VAAGSVIVIPTPGRVAVITESCQIGGPCVR
jgi:hypothetical protein